MDLSVRFLFYDLFISGWDWRLSEKVSFIDELFISGGMKKLYSVSGKFV